MVFCRSFSVLVVLFKKDSAHSFSSSNVASNPLYFLASALPYMLPPFTLVLTYLTPYFPSFPPSQSSVYAAHLQASGAARGHPQPGPDAGDRAVEHRDQVFVAVGYPNGRHGADCGAAGSHHRGQRQRRRRERGMHTHISVMNIVVTSHVKRAPRLLSQETSL